LDVVGACNRAQRDEYQNRREEEGRTSPNAVDRQGGRDRSFSESETKDEVVKLLTEAFPDRTRVIETVKYFATGLGSPADREESGMPTV
jgi:hypothetical protein